MRFTRFDPKYLLHRSKNCIVAAYASQYATGYLIDLGCGSTNFQPLFDGQISEYIRFDYPSSKEAMGYQNAKIDIGGNVTAIPVRTSSVDCALLLDVLEHVFDVDSVIRNISRILKPGGTLLLTTPFIYPVHGKPDDFHRFTFYSLTNYLLKHNLEIVESSTMGDYGTVLAVLVNQFLFRGHQRLKLRLSWLAQLLTPLLLIIFAVINSIGRLLDRVTRDQPCWVYLENAVVCRKTCEIP